MSKLLRCQISPVVLKLCSFSSIKITRHLKITKPKLLCQTKPNFCSLFQYRSFVDTPSSLITNIDYNKLKEFIIQNEALIIDVRTEEEVAATGRIPHSYNIPLNELNSAFEMSPDEFLTKYNTTKPDKNRSVVFSCAKGIRSLKACNLIAILGYKNIFNYTEGWYGWESHK